MSQVLTIAAALLRHIAESNEAALALESWENEGGALPFALQPWTIPDLRLDTSYPALRDLILTPFRFDSDPYGIKMWESLRPHSDVHYAGTEDTRRSFSRTQESGPICDPATCARCGKPATTSYSCQCAAYPAWRRFVNAVDPHLIQRGDPNR